MTVPDHLPLLCVGCPPRERQTAERTLGSLGLSVLWAKNERDAVSAVARAPYTVLLDLTCRDALPTARALRRCSPAVVMIGLADDAKRENVADALREGILEVASKPVVAAELAGAIARAQQLRAEKHCSVSLLPSADAVFVRSAPMQTAVDMAWRAALTYSPTLIIGEPQTGREFLARTIHSMAGQHANSFVKIDCAELKPTDVEIQLFGFRLEGAEAIRPNDHMITPWSGLYRAARGTIFLKHFSTMPLNGRAMLARALRLRQASLDGRRTIDLKIRIIVAAGPSAGDERTCAELYAGTPFIRLHVPPLRQRREDMSLLANHFLDRICKSDGVFPKVLTSTALALLAALPWRGNAGELRSLLKELVAQAPGGVIRFEDVLPHLRLGFGSSVEDNTLRQARSRFERDYITTMLDRHGGRVGETARVLGMLRPNLHRKMRRLRIVRGSGPAAVAHVDLDSAHELPSQLVLRDVAEQE